MQNIKSKVKKFIYKVFGLNSELSRLQNTINSQNKFINDLMTYQIHCQEDNPSFFPIVLTNQEIQLLKKYLQSSENYLEFGSGGSTFLAAMMQRNIYSVESDANWVKYLCSWKIIQNQVDIGRLKFINIDIGPTGRWGIPTDLNNKDKFYQYSSYIFENSRNNFDTVFIDGRFRVACVLRSIMSCSDNVVILIHDYPDREHYHIIETYMDIVEKAEKLYVFKKKTNIDYTELNKLYEKYKQDYR